MNAAEAIEYVHTCHWQASVPGLDRIRTLLAALGNPQQGQKFVHVAGTDGKGSTCAMLSSILCAAGYRVGLNTSPYLEVFNERIRLNGQNIPDADLASLFTEILPLADAMADRPNEFELITAAALLYFRRQNCDISVLEVGMGGEKDASNVIDVPEAAVITAMGWDHVKELGPTMADIASAKAGIIKPGGAVVSYGGVPEADAVIRRTCAEKRASLTEVDFFRLHLSSVAPDGCRFNFFPWENLFLPLGGAYQPKNAATALTAVEVLRAKGWRISDDAVRTGLAEARWPGRFELLHRRPDFLLDGAHNPHGMAAAVESIRVCYPGRKLVFLVGAMADKDVSHMMTLLSPLAQSFFTVRPDNPRAMSAEALRDLLAPAGIPVTACEKVDSAVHAAVSAAGKDGVVCALGSLYLSAAVRRAVAALPD
ncbi:MAG: bifunctional folylpolyglutamate synthase/dihydrofolate synthase [Oscillibacter sp.]|nr:bifunctional folylpolyglutamate synthase/dihydrofolate synthase [Oscillibacter sp.]